MTSFGIVGATGAVGSVLRELLSARDVRYFASSRSAGTELDGRLVEEATPETLAEGGLDVCFFAVDAASSRALVPAAARGGALCIDKSAAWRKEAGVPLVVPEVNGDRALEHEGVIAVPNCSTIQLSVALKPLHDAAWLTSVRLATYQSVSGLGSPAMDALRVHPVEEHDARGDWDYDGEEFEEETKIRDETRRVFELPDLPIQATCVRVPVLVGHLQAVWIETEEELEPEQAEELLAGAPGVRLAEFPSPSAAAGEDDVLVGRIRRDPAARCGLTLTIAADNLRKGAALNAVQIADYVLETSSISI